MTKIIIYPACTLDRFYEQTLEYLYDKYHTYPTTLNQEVTMEAEAARLSYCDGLGQVTARHALNGLRASPSKRNLSDQGQNKSNGNLPLGKTVF